LTITLPGFGKDFQKGLDQGWVDRRLFTGFRWKGGLPVFLRGFLDRVFDRNSGLLLDDPCIDAILAIRQLTLMFGKIEIPCSDTRVRDAMREFIKCEQDVRVADRKRSQSEMADFKRVSAMLFANAFSEVDRKIYNMEVSPKHGPGHTADRLKGNEKYRQTTWPARLEKIFPSGEFLLPNWRYYDSLERVDILEPEAEIPVRVVSVPKTLKTPRIIGIEPTAMQYAQQAVLPLILHSLSRDDNLDTMLGFSDQTPNQRMAREGSCKGTLATLDLSEASDRVSNQLVRAMLSNHPHLHEAVDATRSRKADVPGHGVVRLSKFASMGSALCFPIEAMVFLTIVFIGLEQGLNRPLRKRDIKMFRDQVRIYGDDILVPVDMVHPVVDALHSFGSVVNINKSFWTGKFRESCGKEYYDGHDVSIVKVRDLFPARREDATGVISMISLRNQLYFAGYWGTCAWLDDKIRDVIRHFPVVLPSSPVHGRHSFLGYEIQKMCDSLHRPLVRGYVENSSIPSNSLDDVGALLKFLIKRGGQPSVDIRHLERSGRPQRVDIKLRMAPPF
jgi:hypothetical protein